MEGKLEQAWKTFALNPILHREEEEVIQEVQNLGKQGTIMSAVTSASAARRANAALAVQVQEEQMKALTAGQL